MVRRIDEGEKPMPEINPEKVCFIVEMARNLLGEDVGIEPDASNPTDDDERIVLTDANSPMRRELVQYVRDLDADETAALLALAWIGRGDYEAEDWMRAVKAASERDDKDEPAWRYLLELPLLPDYLEDALSAFGRSCEDFQNREEE
jgi:Protein of unknown function (DUF3775)